MKQRWNLKNQNGKENAKKKTHNPRERKIPAYTLRMRESKKAEHTLIEDQREREREREMGKERKKERKKGEIRLD